VILFPAMRRERASGASPDRGTAGDAGAVGSDERAPGGGNS
jgi:hypothetical protein